MCKDGQTEVTDGELVRQMQEGDLRAFDVIFERYRGALLSYLVGLSADRALAEDVVQDVFVKLAARIASIDSRRNVRGWLYRAARNRWLDQLKRRRRELPWEPEMTAEGVADGPHPSAPLMADERQAAIQSALLELDVKQREVLVLHYFEGMSFREIAGVLRRPLGTVLWQSRRGLKRLKKVLDVGEVRDEQA